MRATVAPSGTWENKRKEKDLELNQVNQLKNLPTNSQKNNQVTKINQLTIKIN